LFTVNVPYPGNLCPTPKGTGLSNFPITGVLVGETVLVGEGVFVGPFVGVLSGSGVSEGASGDSKIFDSVKAAAVCVNPIAMAIFSEFGWHPTKMNIHNRKTINLLSILSFPKTQNKIPKKKFPITDYRYPFRTLYRNF
jgi:hypothetical protein